MNFRPTVVAILATALAVLALPASAQHPAGSAKNPATVSPAQRAALLQKLSRGPGFTSNNQPYQTLPEAQASRLARSEPVSRGLQRLGVSASDLIETKGSYLLYRRAAGTAPAAVVEQTDESVLYPVVLNTATRQTGFLPGTIRVTFTGAANPETLAADHSLSLVRAFPHLGEAYFRAAPGRDVIAAAAALAGDARVKLAEPEVIEFVRVPR
jgi:hypothetical protein